MASDVRGQLIALLKPRENWHPDDLADAADAILAEFLVVPRSEIVGTEYGWQYLLNGQWQTVSTEDRQQAIDNAAYQRDSEGAEWAAPARAVERPIPPWSVIPLPESGGPE